MYGLTLAHLTNADHERDLEADLRQRRILRATNAPRRPAAAATADAIALPISRDLRATGRVRTVGR